MDDMLNMSKEDRILFLAIKYKEAKEEGNEEMCRFYQNLYLFETYKEEEN